ncbi:hypothetical protein [Gluconobacter oxydans]|uniref:hypothetical protein n=1 Tax=Gluconobacter oxydans TaxID=442 RepID=UPI0039EBD606
MSETSSDALENEAAGPGVVPLTDPPYVPFPNGVPTEALLATEATRAAWPARYYASYDRTAPQPTSVTGWWDVWDMSDVSNVPPAADMVALTGAQWSARLPFGAGVQDGQVVAYVPPSAPLSVQVQAETEMSWIHQQASLAAAMGQSFTQAMRDYVTAVSAIAAGTDTTTAALPARPADIMA